MSGKRSVPLCLFAAATLKTVRDRSRERLRPTGLQLTLLEAAGKKIAKGSITITKTIRPDGPPLTLALTLALVCCALAPFLSGCSKPPAPSLGPQEVLVTEVIQQDVPVVREWIASLDGSVNADIRARVSGYLISQNYKEGTFVHQGELLFQIDPSTYEAAVEQAKSSLAQSEANQLQAEQSAKRETQLFEQKVESAQARDNAVQANVAAQAEVKAQQAALRQAELNLQFTKITAP